MGKSIWNHKVVQFKIQYSYVSEKLSGHFFEVEVDLWASTRRVWYR